MMEDATEEAKGDRHTLEVHRNITVCARLLSSEEDIG